MFKINFKKCIKIIFYIKHQAITKINDFSLANVPNMNNTI